MNPRMVIISDEDLILLKLKHPKIDDIFEVIDL